MPEVVRSAPRWIVQRQRRYSWIAKLWLGSTYVLWLSGVVLALVDLLGPRPHRFIGWTAVALGLAGIFMRGQKRRRAYEAAADALELAIIEYETTESQGIREVEKAAEAIAPLRWRLP
jgi:flagellar biosynthesis component FlhA